MAIPGASEVAAGSTLFESAFANSGRHGDFDGPIQSLARALQRLDASHRRIRRQFAEALGLSASEFNALMIVSQTNHITPKQLAASLGLTNGAVTAMLDRLDADGYIVRKPNPTDRRSLFIEMSPRGAKGVRRVAAEYLDMVAGAVSTSTRLSDANIAALVEHTADAILAASKSMAAPTF